MLDNKDFLACVFRVYCHGVFIQLSGTTVMQGCQGLLQQVSALRCERTNPNLDVEIRVGHIRSGRIHSDSAHQEVRTAHEYVCDGRRFLELEFHDRVSVYSNCLAVPPVTVLRH